MCAAEAKLEWDWRSRFCFCRAGGTVDVESSATRPHFIIPDHQQTLFRKFSPESISAMEPAAALPQTELVSTDLKPQEISFALPKALHTTAHIHLTVLERCATVYITTSTPGDSAGSVKPLGSFVYAMPDVSPSPLPQYVLQCANI